MFQMELIVVHAMAVRDLNIRIGLKEHVSSVMVMVYLIQNFEVLVAPVVVMAMFKGMTVVIVVATVGLAHIVEDFIIMLAQPV